MAVHCSLHLQLDLGAVGRRAIHELVEIGPGTLGLAQMQTLGDLFDREFLARFGQGPDEVMPVHIVQKDVLALVAAAHDACPAVAFGEGG